MGKKLPDVPLRVILEYNVYIAVLLIFSVCLARGLNQVSRIVIMHPEAISGGTAEPTKGAPSEK